MSPDCHCKCKCFYLAWHHAYILSASLVVPNIRNWQQCWLWTGHVTPEGKFLACKWYFKAHSGCFSCGGKAYRKSVELVFHLHYLLQGNAIVLAEAAEAMHSRRMYNTWWNFLFIQVLSWAVTRCWHMAPQKASVLHINFLHFFIGYHANPVASCVVSLAMLWLVGWW